MQFAKQQNYLTILNKLKATSIHFLLSLLIFTTFILALRYFWYPEPYFTASGGWQGLKIIAFIDIVLGPLLTFVVFNLGKTKKELTTDLSFIFILQLSALIWGINTVYSQRPIAITFWEHSFYTVPYSDVSQTYLDSKILSEIINRPRSFYFVHKPITLDATIQLNDEVTHKRLTPFQLIDRYEPLKLHFNNIKKYSIDINEVITTNKDMEQSLAKLLAKTTTNITENIYIPLISRYQNIILVFTQKGTLLGSIKAPYKDKT